MKIQSFAISHVIDTNAHADHMSGLPFFRERYGAKTRLFMCHDYRPGGRPLAYETTVGSRSATTSRSTPERPRTST